MRLTPDSICERKPGMAYRVIDGETVVVKPETGEVAQLNESASFIWLALDGKRSLKDIALSMTEEFEVSVEIAEKDALDCLSLFAESDLIALIK